MIDAHVHVWQIGEHGGSWPTVDLPAIHRDFLLRDFRCTDGTAKVDGVILVQSQDNAIDTHWLLSLAERDALIVGVVGWTDLRDPNQIVQLAANPIVRGLRPMVQNHPGDWFDDPRIDDGLAAMATAGLVLDALVRPHHLPGLARVAERHPTLTIVVNHAAKPDPGDLRTWVEDMRALAAHDAAWCKLSGLLTELRPGQDQTLIIDVVDELVAIFGHRRLIWGSDWPVLELASSYSPWLTLAQSLIPPEHHRAVFHENATRAYGITA